MRSNLDLIATTLQDVVSALKSKPVTTQSLVKDSLDFLPHRSDTVMDNATSQIATRRNQRDSSKCRRLALGT